MWNYGNQEISLENDLESSCRGGNGDSGCAGRKCDDPVMRSDNDF